MFGCIHVIVLVILRFDALWTTPPRLGTRVPRSDLIPSDNFTDDGILFRGKSGIGLHSFVFSILTALYLRVHGWAAFFEKLQGEGARGMFHLHRAFASANFGRVDEKMDVHEPDRTMTQRDAGDAGVL